MLAPPHEEHAKTPRLSADVSDFAIEIAMCQLLRAKLTSATVRRDKAAAEMARFQSAIDEHKADKRPRIESDLEGRPPNWEKFKDYTKSTYQELESKELSDCSLDLLTAESKMTHFQAENRHF